VTVRDWIARRTPGARPALVERVLAALAADADAPELRTAELCLAAAARSLDALLSESRFGRDSALDLLTIDALTTYAFEHASESGASEAQLEALAKRGAHLLGQLTIQRV
jgi:hypothetical protein